MKINLKKEIKLPTAALGLSTIPQSKHLLTSCLDGSVILMDPDKETWIPLGHHSSYASGVTSILDGTMAVSAGYDGILQWHDLRSAQTVAVEKVHDFWSWQLKSSKDGKLVATSTGQYLSGGYKYEPSPEKEPSIKVFNTRTRNLIAKFSHLPPVLSIAFSPDNRLMAAANMMGDIKIWNIESQKLLAEWNTPDFTSWGIIKSHHYIGGIFDLSFSPQGKTILACGMGPMRDPMAGNGKQTWQEFDWQTTPTAKIKEIMDSERGRGLMETLSWHPDNKTFCMAGRMAQGNWNTALFNHETGELLQSVDNKTRITKSLFTEDGNRLILAGATSQGGPENGKWRDFGRLFIYDVSP